MTKMTAEQVAAELASQIIDADTVWCRANESALRESVRLIREHIIETAEQRRERFEAWFWWFLLRHKDAAELNGADESKRDAARQMTFVRDSDGSYGTYGVEEVWMAWQAALTWRGEMKGGE